MSSWKSSDLTMLEPLEARVLLSADGVTGGLPLGDVSSPHLLGATADRVEVAEVVLLQDHQGPTDTTASKTNPADPDGDFLKGGSDLAAEVSVGPHVALASPDGSLDQSDTSEDKGHPSTASRSEEHTSESSHT